MSGETYIGVAHLELHIPEARNLKAKRAPVRSLVEKIRNRHQVLVIEADHQDLYQRAGLAICRKKQIVFCYQVDNYQRLLK